MHFYFLNQKKAQIFDDTGLQKCSHIQLNVCFPSVHSFLISCLTAAPAFTTTPPVASLGKVLCRYHPHCKAPTGSCPFYHPATKQCRYGAACMHRATTCPFAHPPAPSEGTKALANSRHKWVRPTTTAAGEGDKKKPESTPKTAAAAASPVPPAVVTSPPPTEVSS